MSDAIEAAAKALCLATGLDWDSIEDAEDGDGLDSPLGPETKRYFRQWFNAALTAYEAAKGGGVGAWQWHDFSGNWYTVDSARMTLADQEKLAKACAEDHGGRARPLYANPKPDGSALTSPASGERDAWAGSAPFITSESGGGEYAVRVKVHSMDELHVAHTLVLKAFGAKL